MPIDRNHRWRVLCLAVCLLILLSGCQMIGGLDVSKALTQSVNASSYEGEHLITVEFQNDGAAKPISIGKSDWTALNKAKLVLTHWKKQNKDLSSFDGKLILENGSEIGLRGWLTSGQILLQVEGAKAPVVFDIGDGLDSLISGFTGGNLLSGIPLGKSIQDSTLTDSLLAFLIQHTPNPKRTSVRSVTEQINGETLQLQSIHMKLDGSEFNSLISKLIESVLSDEQGLRMLVGQIVKGVFPSIGGVDLSPIYTEFTLSMVKQQLLSFKANLNDNDAQVSSMNNPKTSLQLNVMVDKDQYVRKLNWSIGLPFANGEGFNQLKLSGTNMMWNIGQPVRAEKVLSSEGAIRLGTQLKWPALVSKMEPKSPAYDFVMNGLKVSRKSLSMEMRDNTGGDVNRPLPYINGNNFTVVPVRYVSEQLDADVKWNGETREVTIVNAWTGKQLVLQIGSNIAYIDGVAEDIGTQVELTNSTTYVPLRFIAERIFGAEVGFKQANGVSTVTIVKN
jgi:hypothetical protein